MSNKVFYMNDIVKVDHIFIHSFPIISSSIVSNDYLTLNQLNKFCRYINIGDLIAVLGPIDFVLGSVDLIERL